MPRQPAPPILTPLVRKQEAHSPVSLLPQLLLEYYNTAIAPGTVLHQMLEDGFIKCYVSWRIAADEARIPVVQWIRNRVAEAPADEHDTIRRMLEKVLATTKLSPPLSNEERTVLTVLLPFLSRSPEFAPLLDVDDDVPLEPVVIARFFSAYGRVSSAIADAIVAKTQRSQPVPGVETPLATVEAVLQATPESLQEALAGILLTHWRRCGLPPLTVTRIPQLPGTFQAT